MMDKITVNLRGTLPTVSVKIGRPQGISTGFGNVKIVERVESDYEKLDNLPSINGITLIGDTTIAELLANGIIINGGDAGGF